MAELICLHSRLTILQAVKLAAQNDCCIIVRNGRPYLAPIDSPEPKIMTARIAKHKRLQQSLEKFEETRNQRNPTHVRNVPNGRNSRLVSALPDFIRDV